MGLFRVHANRDSWITNAYSREGVSEYPGSGSNHGRSPTLRVFSLKNNARGEVTQLARTLVNFSTTELSGKIFGEKTIPSSSIKFFLKMFNFVGSSPNPSSYSLQVFPISSSWHEGNGTDDDDYLDKGFCNWHDATSTASWVLTGSDFLATGYGAASQSFDYGDEDLEVEITPIVNNWLSWSIGQNGLPNNGLLIKLSGTEESNGLDYFQKVFHARETKYVDRMPYIEARWEDFEFDNRSNFAYGISNDLYIHNFYRGALQDIQEPLFVRIQNGLVGASASYVQTFTGSEVATGIGKITINMASSGSHSGTFYDIWHSSNTVYMTGTFSVARLTASQVTYKDDLVFSVSNVKKFYSNDEEAFIRLHARKGKYLTHVAHSASTSLDLEYLDNVYYSIRNEETYETVVPFGTGSLKYTKLSYDKDGNYFKLNMNAFVPGFTYKLLFLVDLTNSKKVVDPNIIFRIS